MENLANISHKLRFDKEQTHNPEFEKICRKAITDWANKIPHHEHKDLGNEITITRITEKPIYYLELKGQYEERKLANVYRPYKGEEIPKRTIFSINEVDPWKYDLRRTDAYINKKLEYPLEESQYVDTCEVCHGEGKTTCPECGGKRVEVCDLCGGDGREYCSNCGGAGREECYMCKGSGRKDAPTSCSSCGGSGSIILGDGSRGTCGSCGGSGKIMRRAPCDNCGGSGNVKCRTCFGRGTFTCSRCGGSGKVTCSRCHGRGKITCEKCKGFKRLVRFIILFQEFMVKTFNNEYFPDTIKEKFPEFSKSMKKTKNREIFRQSHKSFPHNYLQEAPQLQGLWKSLYGSGKNKIVPGSSVMHFQTLCISEKPVYEVAYTFHDKNYTLLVYGTDSLIYAPENPILDECKRMLREAFILYRKRKLVKSRELLQITQAIDIENQLEDIPVLRELLRNKFKSGYVTGTVLSTVLLAYFGTLFNLSFFKDPHFIWYVPTKYFESTPEMAMLYPILIAGGFGYALYRNFNKSKETAIKRFSLFIYRHPLRIAAGFLYNLYMNLKSLVVIYTLAFSGAILFAYYVLLFAIGLIRTILGMFI